MAAVDDRHYFEVPDQSTAWAIGDVHGCASQFRQLVQQIRDVDPTAMIFQLGDLIDRGPDLLDVIDVVEQYGVINLLGNHELNFLLELDGYKTCRSKVRRVTHDTFQQLSDDERERVESTLRRSLNYAQVGTAQRSATLSHAPIRRQFDVSMDGGNGWVFCSGNKPHEGYNSVLGQRVIDVHGHQHWNYRSIGDQIADGKNAFNIDGGCVYGQELIGLCLTDLSYITIKCPVDYTDNQ